MTNRKIKGKNGGRFYVKTYGPTYGINCDYQPVKGGQKWMVYLGNKHIETFRSEAEAKRKCKKLNEDYDASVSALKRREEQEKTAVCNTNTFNGLYERICFFESAIEEMRVHILGLKEHIVSLRERYEG